jgi:hypothetical protein
MTSYGVPGAHYNLSLEGLELEHLESLEAEWGRARRAKPLLKLKW